MRWRYLLLASALAAACGSGYSPPDIDHEQFCADLLTIPAKDLRAYLGPMPLKPYSWWLVDCYTNLREVCQP